MCEMRDRLKMSVGHKLQLCSGAATQKFPAEDENVGSPRACVIDNRQLRWYGSEEIIFPASNFEAPFPRIFSKVTTFSRKEAPSYKSYSMHVLGMYTFRFQFSHSVLE